MLDPQGDLPELSSHYRLSDEQIAAFRRDGHVHLRGVASPDVVAAYRPVVQSLVEQQRSAAPLEQRSTYHRAFVQVRSLWLRSDALRPYILSQRFARIAAQLMGVSAVRLYQDRAIFKEAGGGPTPWHQDRYYWPLETDDAMITMWMPLVDVPREMGTMVFATGSHRHGLLVDRSISDDSDDYFQPVVDAHGFALAQYAMAAGDATFHAPWTLHRAPPNATDRVREAVAVHYMAAGLRVREPDNVACAADLARWLPGLQGGDAAETAMNPLVYAASDAP
jgi:ectoine hydroxylase-related dioxygenase (phytanoyl-CoA dioxygenase family)